MSPDHLFRIVPGAGPSHSAGDTKNIATLAAIAGRAPACGARPLFFGTPSHEGGNSMLKKWIGDRAGRASGVAKRTRAAMANSALSMALALAAQAEHSSTDKGSWIRVCKADIQRFCDEANLKQECLVAHWSKISSECRDVLGTSAGDRAGDGS